MKIFCESPYHNVIDIVESINNQEILSAKNLVIEEVYDSGMKTKKYLKSNNNENFNVLMILLATT